jgi:(p)ppGpp synthase/HD superfamily hydrolase
MEPKAQTILQLFSQLSRHGFRLDDLQRAQRAYALTVALTTCQYRSSGRTQIDHAVGVTSLLVGTGAEIALVIAGLAHNSYLHGDFGTWRRRTTPSKRDRVRQVIGADAEELVYRYTQLEWTDPSIARLREFAPSFDPIERSIVLMRLADQLDIYGERDVLYCRNVAQRRAYARDAGPQVCALAERAGFPVLAAALTRAFKGLLDSEPRMDVNAPAWPDGVIVPASYRTRPGLALYQTARARLYRLTGR